MLKIKIVTAPMVKGGRAIVLCDEDGQILPGQVRAVLETEANETPLFTVTFEVDGKDVKIVD